MTSKILAKLALGKNISSAESEHMMSAIADGKLSPEQSAAFLTALTVKGETADEIAGCLYALRKRALKVPHRHKTVFDCCGTGGDRSGSFNISTAVAFVVAACGIPTAKHGNRSISSVCGSADVLEQLGVKIDLKPQSAAICLNELGICFMFAPVFHPAMKNAAPIRRKLGFRTVFNLLGPLLNPANASHQIIGAASFEIAEKLALTASKLDDSHIRLLHNSDGLDELAPFGENWIISADHNGISRHKLNLPTANGLDRSCLAGGDAQTNAQIIRQIFAGETSPRRMAVVLNAAVGLALTGAAPDFKQGSEMAGESLDSGRAMDKLKQLTELSNRLE